RRQVGKVGEASIPQHETGTAIDRDARPVDVTLNGWAGKGRSRDSYDAANAARDGIVNHSIRRWLPDGSLSEQGGGARQQGNDSHRGPPITGPPGVKVIELEGEDPPPRVNPIAAPAPAPPMIVHQYHFLYQCLAGCATPVYPPAVLV